MSFEANYNQFTDFIPWSQQSPLRVLVVTAALPERDAVLRGLKSDPRFEVLLGGVGPVAAGVNTSRALAAANYNLVISAGFAGGFPNRAEVGSVVVGTEIVAADLGAETPEGFSSLNELGFGSTCIRTDKGLVDYVTKALVKAKLRVFNGPVLTVSTVTGTAETAKEMMARIPRAAAEAMEGYGVGFAALDQGLPVIEVRAISNMVGPRNRSAWRIREALEVLEAVFQVLSEVSI
ncbi:futalosine nucleosidase [Desulfosporosinus orientis DSM 765]|uniref:Futalosine hydrolase n=1 Tax=Desulfosporosinus orientis (strain ATCC 19365 / DSM 765 / NCIMB 8382 / VKM B-1628 / Singapore I) TaxID=768706 RepID=G7WAD4_DESOD|nr:futalosine hydrolase [Desulfosporosinus orientis]AET66483.1 futalosine nucleosidase [Desulfosporosinus orientis DSM 765]